MGEYSSRIEEIAARWFYDSKELASILGKERFGRARLYGSGLKGALRMLKTAKTKKAEVLHKTVIKDLSAILREYAKTVEEYDVNQPENGDGFKAWVIMTALCSSESIYTTEEGRELALILGL